MPKQQKSLFSFFSPKTQVQNRTTLTENENASNVKKSPENKNKNVIKSSSTGDSHTAPKKETPKKKTADSATHWSVAGDIVWARLDGYPWWPALICNHPTKSEHVRSRKGKLDVHVQFFDDPPNRAWIREKSIRKFEGLNSRDYQRGGVFYSSDPDQFKAAKQAEEARSLNKAERLEKLLVVVVSEDEEEEEEEESADPVLFDNDIFDAEGDEDLNVSKGSNESKENRNISPSNNSNRGTPSKSPKKSRSGRPQKKRRRVHLSESCEDDSEDEFKLTKKEVAESSSDASSSGEDDDDDDDDKESSSGSGSAHTDDESPVKKPIKRKRSENKPASLTSTPSAASKPTTSHKSSAIKKFRLPNLPDDDDDVMETDIPEDSPTGIPSPKTPIRPHQSSSNTTLSEPRTPKMFSPSVKKVDTTLPEPRTPKMFSPSVSKSDTTLSEPGTPKMFSPSVSKSDTTLSEPGTPKMVSPSVSKNTMSKLAAFSAPTPVDQPRNEDGQLYTHLTLAFLKPEKIRDNKNRPRSDADYDARTLHVPKDFLFKQTPAHKQWWIMKSDHYDTVLFFKVGKFYELFHMDAVIGVKELGIIFMKGNYAHSGFPEIAYGRYSGILIQRGYKVGRVEQTETPDMLAERVKQTATKVDKVVKREVCRITTKGTKTFSFIDGSSSGCENNFLLAVCEKPGDVIGSGSQYGVCFVDTSIGKFRLGQFTDDRHCSRFRTLIAHYSPVQILYERGRLTAQTFQLISNTLPSVVKEALTPVKEFWDSSKTLKMLSEGDYFTEETDDNRNFSWPECLKTMLSAADSLGLTAADQHQMAVSALGAITWYLSDCLLDEELLSMRQFELYTPIDNLSQSKPKDRSTDFMAKASMILDGVTLANLEVVENATSGTLEGTLLDRLDTCTTPFGKRLFRQWLCAPLCNPVAIGQRQNAVDDLIGCYDLVAEVKESMKKLPDLERLLSKIHTLGSASRSKNHPDSRAIFYEDTIYGKRKIEDFLDALTGFKLSMKIIEKLKKVVSEFKSDLLKQTVGLPGQGRFPDITEDLQFFDNAFDHDQAKKEGKIIPHDGVDQEYDDSIEQVEQCVEKFTEYLKEQKRELGIKNLTYWGTGRNRYQLEISDAVAKRVPNDFTLKSSKKGFKRYWSPSIERMLSDLSSAEDRKDAAVRDVMRRIFHSFDKRYQKWERCVECMSVLDVLVTMTDYSRCGDGSMCRPLLITPSNNNNMDCGDGESVGSDVKPFIEIRNGRHPCITRTYSGGDFIPNDIVIGTKDDNGPNGDSNHGDGSVALVTGPNMGGKSTLMRQAGLIVILAQMGCYVPCESCRLTPVDRIFTRLGASDNIMGGESTFYVELSETSAILQHATQHSLILMDELGRGTATYDGTAIASAVVREISQNIGCRTLFSTHYHSLVEDFSHDPNIRLGHMACMVESENDEDPTQETITFLYKFIHGACPKSYGFNAARLAELPDEVIRKAHKKARDFETSLEKLKLFRSLQSVTVDNVNDEVNKVRALIAAR